MTAIWQNDGDARKLLSPEGFPAEAALHDLVAQSPELLPLSGSPRLAVLGREVQLGTGYADILAIEDNGRLVVIEVKLSRNSEARRAVVAQVLAYAAYLDGMDADELETGLSRSLAGTSIRETVSSSLGDVRDWRDVEEGLRASLAEGWFRLVLVLDEAPDDLVRLVGYLKRITSEQIIVDLVTVASYAVEGTQVVVPQRVDARSRELAPPDVLPDRRAGSSRAAGAPIVQGSSAFEEFLPEIVGEHRERLAAIAAWTKEIESRGHALLRTSIGSGRRVLRVQVLGESASIVALWAERQRPGMSVHTTVLERRAPEAAAAVRALIPDGTNPYLNIDEVGEPLLRAVEVAYRESASGRITLGPSAV